MEVHKHPHHVTHKKKWVEYVLEFLMIFLAVFLGFVAENMREQIAERKNEKVFMRNIYEDLKADTSSYLKFVNANEEFFQSVDTLMAFMKGRNRDIRLSKIYYLVRVATMNTNYIFLYFTQRTFSQMKNSGQLKLISDRAVADSISSYYYSLEIMSIQNEAIQNRISDYMRTVGELFDAEILFKVFKERKEPQVQNLRLRTNDSLALNKYLTATQYLYGSRNVQRILGFERAAKAKNLMELIKKEYNLTDK